ncbi:cupin domain-containing protein [Rhizobium sp. SL42]|uniref:cupin domain-containing protein n=1 Tax=Rhizobium sp. SL42 TaxID=2806346 RepID=UPI001F19B770|nr:cupin domain-containing protein [Rhizobium sp. SL42]UJW76141.1 cupin domain-containing protein [Rhizobium sp. SL42]
MNMQDRPGMIGFGRDRFDKPVRFLNGRFDCKVSARDTDGALCIIDTFRDSCGGPPLHYHALQDEWFMVLEGEFLFQLGDQLFHATAGCSIFGPRMVPHSFRNLTDKARMLLVFQPALDIETFFSTGVTLHQAQTDMFDALSLAHHIHNVGPPLSQAQADALRSTAQPEPRPVE